MAFAESNMSLLASLVALTSLSFSTASEQGKTNNNYKSFAIRTLLNAFSFFSVFFQFFLLIYFIFLFSTVFIVSV